MHFRWALYERCTEALFVQRLSVFSWKQSKGAVQRRSTYSAQGNIEANLSKRPHFDLAPYIYATLTLGHKSELIFWFHT